MQWSARNLLVFGGIVVAVVASNSSRGLAQQDAAHPATPHNHAEAAKLKNPVPANTTSLATGKKLFATNCVACHGESGKGDGKSAATLTPKPSDLTDATWRHGASDGEIFTLVKDGAKQTSMRGYAGKMTSQELWSVVNYVRSLGSSTNKSQ